MADREAWTDFKSAHRHHELKIPEDVLEKALETTRISRQLDSTGISGLVLAMEKGMDMHSLTSAAQSDITQYYDYILLGRMAKTLNSWNVPPALTLAAIRLHSQPKIAITMGDEKCTINGRVRGLTTGSRSAASLSRVPLQNCVEEMPPDWRKLGYQATGGILTLATWADNLFSIAHCADDAVSILMQFENKLFELWNLRCNPDSKLVMQCPHGQQPRLDLTPWKFVDSMRCLGFMIANNGNSDPAWQKLKESIWHAWRGNLRRSGFRGSYESASRLLTRCAGPIASFHCGIVPWSTALAKRLADFQTFLLARVLATAPRPHESSSHYWQRRHLQAHHTIQKTGAWDKTWDQRITTWLRHIGRHPESWVSRLLRTRDAAWLREQRRMYVGGSQSWTVHAGRTGTRMVPGPVHRRYEDGCRLWAVQHDMQQVLENIWAKNSEN